jgi:signal transduction histidine kinase
VIGAPFLVLGLLLTLSALVGARVEGRGRGTVDWVLASPLHPATWSALGAIILGFWVELFAFAAIVTLLSVGASILVIGVGFVLIGVAIELARGVARTERRRMLWADPAPLTAHPYRPYGQGPRELILAVFLDLNRWRDVVYVLIAFPLAVLEFAVVVALWSASLVLLSLPLAFALGDLPVQLARTGLSDEALVILGATAGFVLLFVAASVTRGLMILHRAVVVGLLCVSDRRVLQQRVATLETSRQAVLDVEATELRRIERDLHDGAQQRLVMLAMQLGLAAERIDDDPASAKTLVLDARDQARQALAEIRDLVRGMAPAILVDRGLVAALPALAGRNPVPTIVSSELPEGLRLPDTIERAAYFVVAEAVANVAKHATATRCEIRVRLVDGRLVVEVEDDGVGGAVVVPGGGLAGLAGRVEALDGSLTVISPSAGPTLVRAEIALPRPAAGSPAAPASTAVSSVPPVPPATASPTSGWVAPGQEPR